MNSEKLWCSVTCNIFWDILPCICVLLISDFIMSILCNSFIAELHFFDGRLIVHVAVSWIGLYITLCSSNNLICIL
jgi:hypothetical protein